MIETLDWFNYHGEALCPRRGKGTETGSYYKTCAEYSTDIKYQIQWNGGDGIYTVDDIAPHAMACERYTYASELCAECANPKNPRPEDQGF